MTRIFPTFEQRKAAANFYRRDIEKQMARELANYRQFAESSGREFRFPIDADHVIERWLQIPLIIGSIAEVMPQLDKAVAEKCWGTLGRDQDGDLAIVIDEKLSSEYYDCPYRFTAIHEVVHWFRDVTAEQKHGLQQTLPFASGYVDPQYFRILCRYGEEEKYQERNANYGAACFLAPKDELNKQFSRWLESEKLGPTYLLTEAQPDTMRSALENIRRFFGLSRQAMQIRFQECGLFSAADQGTLY